MKNLTLVVHADLQQSLADVLRNLKQVSGFTFTPVQGHGPQAEHDPTLSMRDRVVGYTPHARVDIMLNDKDVESVLASLRDAGGGISGRGAYWVTAVEKYGPL